MTHPSPAYIRRILKTALAEDLGRAGDITSQFIFPASKRARAVIKSKDTGVLSGAYLLRPLFALLDPSITVAVTADDGRRVTPGSVIARLDGPIRGILAGERVALNFLQRLGGIATQTAALAGLISHTPARLLDTRKTTPGLRALEKRAVVHGGGCNHRFGLFDMVLIKDTHVKAAGGPGRAVDAARAGMKHARRTLKIEVEVQSTAEFAQALAHEPDRIMLDNMTPPQMKKCVELRRLNGYPVELEASGNVTGATIREIAETGVDFISVGSITHSVCALDIHLVIV